MRPTITTTALFVLSVLLFSFAAYAVISIGIVSTSPSNAAVTLTVNVPQTFSITLNDTAGVSYSWKVNSTVVQTGSSNSFVFTPNSTGSAIINVNASKTANQSDSVSHTWTTTHQAGALGLSVSPSLNLGGDNQKASNIESERVDAHNVFVEKSLRITNTDANPITGLNVTLEGANGFSLVGDLNLSATLPQTTIAGGNSLDITVRSRVPDRLDSINQSTFKATAPQIAVLTFRGLLANGSQSLVTTSVNMQRKNMLQINDIDVCVETDCEDAGTDAVIQNVKPGDQVDIEVSVTSLFSTGDDEDLDIQDVELSFAIDEDELTEDENEDLGDLGARDEDVHTFTLDIPDDLDSGIYDVFITVIGKDENGAFQGDVNEFKLDIDRKSHDVTLQSLLVNPQTVNLCNQRSFILTITTQNIGESDEDEARLIIRNSDLGIDRTIGPFLLEQDRKRTDTLTFDVPSNINGGDFTILAKSFFDTDKQTDEEGVVVDLESCQAQQTPAPNQLVVDNSSTSTIQQRNGSSTVKTTTRGNERTLSTPTSSTSGRTSKSSLGSPLMIFGAIFAVLVVLLVVVLVIVRRK